MNSVGIKLEAALKAYLAANYQGTGDELAGVSIYLGRTPEAKTAASHMVIAAGSAAGAHMQQGNYEIPINFYVCTDFDKATGDTEASLRLRHGERCSAIRGIFGNDRVLTVRAALMSIDSELGVSAYWDEAESEGVDETRAETMLTYTFEAYLA